MKLVIPLAGFGTRMRPHTYSKPKPLINVAGKPVLAHILDGLSDLDIDEAIFIVGYLGEQIEDFVEKNYSFPATHYVEQKELKGQAHALWLAREYLKGPILIIFVDTIFESDLSVLESPDADGIAFVKEVDDPRRFGVAIVGEDGYVKRLVEKPSSMEHKLAVIGVYYIKQGEELVSAIEELMERNIQTKGEFYLADALQIMIDRGARFKVHTVDVWEDCGKPDAVLKTNRYLLKAHYDNSSDARSRTRDSVIIPPSYVAPTATIEASVVGPYATVSENAVVRDSIVRDSIVDSGATVEMASLVKSLIGAGAVVRGRFMKLNVGDSSQVEFSNE
jgi:glucose-1-phosphate thymidylyltransferase